MSENKKREFTTKVFKNLEDARKFAKENRGYYETFCLYDTYVHIVFYYRDILSK